MRFDKLLSHLNIDVEPFALCLLSEGWRLRLPGPPKVLLHFVLKGSGAVLGPENDKHPLVPGSLSVVPIGAVHALESSGTVQKERRIDAPPKGEAICRLIAGSPQDASLIVACGLVMVRYGETLGLFDRLQELLAVDLSETPEVSTAFQGILTEQSRPDTGSAALTASLMTQCLIHLFRRLARHGPLPWLMALQDEQLGKAIDRILENPGADHTVESLADVAGMSRSTFAERFSDAFERPPMSLVHQVRMQRAAHLLQQREMSVEEVADRVGFSSRSHFSQAFKEHHGESPAMFRDHIHS